MSVNVSFHSHSKYEGPLHVESHVQSIESPSAVVTIRKGAGEVKLFFDNVEDLEKLSFEFSTLVMAARAQWGMDTAQGEGNGK